MDANQCNRCVRLLLACIGLIGVFLSILVVWRASGEWSSGLGDGLSIVLLVTLLLDVLLALGAGCLLQRAVTYGTRAA